MAAPQGFEPRYADPESAVLPLNEGAVCGLPKSHVVPAHVDFMGEGEVRQPSAQRRGFGRVPCQSTRDPSRRW